MNLYIITDYNAPADSSNRTTTQALDAEQVATIYQYNVDSRRIYGHARFGIEAVETNKALRP